MCSSDLEVFSAALQVAAKTIVVAHNHPSGSLKPSVEDRILTTQLKQLGSILGIEVIDHLIVTEKDCSVLK